MLDMDVMGVILPDRQGATVDTLTSTRSVSALPFAGRYRLIDFTLSNLVNVEIDTIAVCPMLDYTSLMEHLSAGKPWDLNRKYNGFSLRPPRSVTAELGEVDLLYNHINYLMRTRERYVVLTYGNVVFNQSLQPFIEFHKEQKAEVTFLYHKEPITKKSKDALSLIMDENDRVVEIVSGVDDQESGNISCGVMIFEKSFLVNLLEYCHARRLHNITMDYLLKKIKGIRAYGFEATGYMAIINDITSYYQSNMHMLRQDIRNSIFAGKDRIYTKVMDSVPTRYGTNCQVDNSLIADGCSIDGTVENSIIFRGVKVSKGASIKNSIVMSGAVISRGCMLENAVLDRDVTLKEGRQLVGDSTYPFIVRKGTTI